MASTSSLWHRQSDSLSFDLLLFIRISWGAGAVEQVVASRDIIACCCFFQCTASIKELRRRKFELVARRVCGLPCRVVVCKRFAKVNASISAIRRIDRIGPLEINPS